MIEGEAINGTSPIDISTRSRFESTLAIVSKFVNVYPKEKKARKWEADEWECKRPASREWSGAEQSKAKQESRVGMAACGGVFIRQSATLFLG